MGYHVDWEQPERPRIVPCDGGEPLESITIRVLNYHLSAVSMHVEAIGGIFADVTRTNGPTDE